jgi:hypothetical protein
MNPIIRAMMSHIGSASKLLGNASNGTSNDMMLKAPDGRSWNDVMQSRNPQGRIDQAFEALPVGPTQQQANGPAPIDRIKAAFEAMRAHQQQPNVMGMSGPAHPDANGVYGPDATMMGQPAPGPMNLASHGVVNCARLTASRASGGAQQQPMGFFMRNATGATRPRRRRLPEPGDGVKGHVGNGWVPVRWTVRLTGSGGASRPSRPFQEHMNRDEDEVIALGNYCEALMLHDSFNTLFEEFKQENVDLMLGTAPHELKKREGIYAEMNGFRAFMALMQGYVIRRNEILKRNDPQPSIAVSDDE